MFQGAGPYTPQEPYPLWPASPTELLYELLLRDVNPAIVQGVPPVSIGGASDAQQQLGVVELMPAGKVSNNPHVPIIDQRMQVRCIHHSLSEAERIGNHVHDLLHTRHREAVTQVSTGNQYLVHRIINLVGPTAHYDSPTTWETLAFYEVMVGSGPIS